jgi:hypothetical protein
MQRWSPGGPAPGTKPAPSAHRGVTEKRGDLRRRVLLPAIIAYAKGMHHFECAIRDLSAGGARIAVPRSAQFPSSFYLIHIREGQAYEARQIRRTGTEVGLQLIRPIDLADPAFAFLGRLLPRRI